METHSSMINCDWPGTIKISEKMKTVKVSSFHKLYDCECNNEEFFRRLSSNSTSQQDLAASGNKVLFDLNKTSKRKQPNIEMREKILANMSKALQENMTKKYGEQFIIDELPCDKESAKWIKIRMYQERARRREARRRRQRQKEREGSRGRKSKKRKRRKRSKSRKGKKGRKRSKSRGRSKSKGRRKSRKSRRKSKSRSRKKSRSGSRRRSGSRKRSVKSSTRRRRRRRT